MKNIADEELGPSICPELSSNVIQTILEINAGLIKVCVEFQNKGWTSDPDFAIYQSRLQSNLAYLAAVADHYLKPERKLTDLPPKPNLTPLPDPRTVSAQMLKKLISKAKNDFENVDTQSLTKVLQRDTEAGKQVERDIKRREEDNKTSRLLSEELDLPVHISKRVLDPQAGSENYQNYAPFPPLQLPEGISDPLVPPHLPEGEENCEVDNAPSATVENDGDMMQTDSDGNNQGENNSNNDEEEEEDSTTITNTTPRPEDLVNRLVSQMFEQNINSNEVVNNIEDFNTNAVNEAFEAKEQEKLANDLLNFPEEQKSEIIEEVKKSKSSIIRELIEQIGNESNNSASEKSS